jgi:hypothetical protein
MPLGDVGQLPKQLFRQGSVKEHSVVSRSSENSNPPSLFVPKPNSFFFLCSLQPYMAFVLFAPHDETVANILFEPIDSQNTGYRASKSPYPISQALPQLRDPLPFPHPAPPMAESAPPPGTANA